MVGQFSICEMAFSHRRRFAERRKRGPHVRPCVRLASYAFNFDLVKFPRSTPAIAEKSPQALRQPALDGSVLFLFR